jgi:hypothetical protein
LPRSFLSLLATFADALDWTYDERLNRYRQASTGHFLSAESIIRLRDEFLDARIVRTRQLAADLADDRITLGEWERGMRDEIKTTVGVEYAFGRGGMNRMQPSDFREMGGLVGDHYRFLNNFAQDISTGNLSEAGIASRAAMYIGSGTTAYERGAASASQVALPVYPGEDCIGLTNCRCSWQLDPLEDGSTDAYWVAEADACDVCAQHAQDYDPLHFPPPVRPGRRAEAAPVRPQRPNRARARSSWRCSSASGSRSSNAGGDSRRTNAVDADCPQSRSHPNAQRCRARRRSRRSPRRASESTPFVPSTSPA